jgi:hypothetical protein
MLLEENLILSTQIQESVESIYDIAKEVVNYTDNSPSLYKICKTVSILDIMRISLLLEVFVKRIRGWNLQYLYMVFVMHT